MTVAALVRSLPAVLGVAFSACLFVAKSPASEAMVPPAIQARWAADGRLELRWPAQASGFRAESADRLTPTPLWQEVETPPILEGASLVLRLTLDGAGRERFFRLRQNQPPTQVVEASPTHLETGVAVTRETVLRLSRPLALNTTLDANVLQADAGGRPLLGRADLSQDRQTLSWFPLEPLPAADRVRVSLNGALLTDDRGRAIDADGDGAEGGVGVLEFETLGTIALPGTAVVGRVFASEPAPDGTDLPLAGVTITVDGAEESVRTVTDATGAFRLEPAPAGRFFVHVDGRTAAGSEWPSGAYYPVVGKAWQAEVGRTNNLAGGTGLVFLPRIQAAALQTVSATDTTVIRFVPEITATNSLLAGVEVRIPPNALFSESGLRGGRVGIAPVAPDRLPEPLPPGLELPLVITIQTDGPQNFDTPVPVRFPNLPDPRTGQKLPPGSKSVLWSFNHDTGRWEAQGTMTVTADGDFAETDPGVGVRQPGWHGSGPGSPGGGPGPSPCESCDDGEDDDDDPNGDDPWKRCQSEVIAAGASGADCLIGLVAPQASSLKGSGPGCGFGIGTGATAAARDCVLDPKGCGLTLVNGVVGTAIGCAELAAETFGKAASRIGPIAQALGILHGCGLGFGLNLCTAIDCIQPGSGAACVPDEWEEDMFRWTNDWWEALNPFDGQSLQGGGVPLSLSRPQLAGNPAEPPGPSPGLLLEAQRQPALAHARFSTAMTRFFEVLYGSPVWIGTDATSSGDLAVLLERLADALEPDSPGGGTVNAAEREFLHTLPRPAAATSTDLDQLIDRLERFNAGTLSDQELRLRALLGYGLKVGEMVQVYQAMGWSHPLDGFRAGLIDLTRAWQPLCQVPPTSGAAMGSGGGSGGSSGAGGSGNGNAAAGPNGRPTASPRPLTWMLTNHETGFVQRGRMQTGTPLPPLILAPETFYSITYVDERSGAVAVAWFRSEPAGRTTTLPCALWLDGAGPALRDSDGDRLPDLAELALGSDPNRSDTDGDGVADGLELFSGANPVSVDLQPTGVLAASDTPGTAIGIAITRDHAYVADSDAGLAVFRLNGPETPLLVARAPEVVTAVAAEGNTVVALAGGARLLILDAANPANPTLRHALSVPNANAVAVQLPWVFVGSGADLLVVDALQGDIRSRLSRPGGASRFDALGTEGPWVYALTQGHLLTFLEENGRLFHTATLPVAGTLAPLENGRKLWVGGERAYAGYFQGYSIFDLANPALPVPRGVQPATQAAIHALTAAGPRLLLPVTSFAGTPTLALSLYDVTDPTDVTRFLTSYNTPGEARAVAFHRGLAYVADGPGGLAVVRPVSRGTERIPPSVAIAGIWATTPDPRTEPGSTLRVPVDADDEGLVREVTLLLDNVVVDRDGSFPFVLQAVVPTATNARTTFELRAIAIDLAGNSRTSAPVVVRSVADASPPGLDTLFPAPGATAARDFFEAVEIRFTEPPAALPEEVLRVWDPGPDAVPGNGDDVLLTNAVVRLDGRTLRWTPAVVPPGNRSYRILLAGGIADAAGNARPLPLAWDFTLSTARSSLTSVSPSGLLPTADTLVSNLVAEFSVAIPPTRGPEVIFRLTSAGADGVLGNADDVVRSTEVRGQDQARFSLAVNPPLAIGRHRLVAQGPPVNTRTLDFALEDPRSLWIRDTSGNWSDTANWSRFPSAASEVVIHRPGADLTVTHVAGTGNAGRLVGSIVCDNGFRHRSGDLGVQGEAVFRGPFLWAGDSGTFDDATLTRGTWRFRGTLELRGDTTANRRPRLAAATALNEGTARWTTGTLDASGADALFVNAAGATFLIEPGAANWAAQGSAGPGRFLNAGTLRKTGTNSVAITGLRTENQGILEVLEGSLSLPRFSGNGSVSVERGATIDLGHQPLLPPAARFLGEGRLILGTSSIASSNREAASLRAEWSVTGTTEFRGAGARILRPLQLPTATFETHGDLVFEAPANLGKLTLDIPVSPRTNTVNAPLEVGELHLLRGTLAGPAPIRVSDTLRIRSASIDDGGAIHVSGRITTDPATSTGTGLMRLGNRNLVLEDTVIQTTNETSILPLRANATASIRNQGSLRLTGPGTVSSGLNLTNAGRIVLEQGTLLLRGGADLAISAVLNATLVQESTAEFFLAGGTLEFQRTQERRLEGTFGGVGTVVFPSGGVTDQLLIQREFRPGNPAGTLTLVNGRLGLTPTARTTFTLGETTASGYKGRIRLDGHLHLAFLPGTDTSPGRTWRLITGSRSGTFATVDTSGLPADRTVAVEYLPDGVVARIAP